MSSDKMPSANMCVQEQVSNSNSDKDEDGEYFENSDNDNDDNGAFNFYGCDDSKINSDSNSNHYDHVRGHAVASAASNTSPASHHARTDDDDMEIILQQIKELEEREKYNKYNTHNISQDDEHENIDDILEQIKQSEELIKRRDEILQQDYEFNKSLENDIKKDSDIKHAIVATSTNTVTEDATPMHKVNVTKNDNGFDDDKVECDALPLTKEQLRLHRSQYFNKIHNKT